MTQALNLHPLKQSETFQGIPHTSLCYFIQYNLIGERGSDLRTVMWQVGRQSPVDAFKRFKGHARFNPQIPESISFVSCSTSWNQIKSQR